MPKPRSCASRSGVTPMRSSCTRQARTSGPHSSGAKASGGARRFRVGCGFPKTFSGDRSPSRNWKCRGSNVLVYSRCRRRARARSTRLAASSRWLIQVSAWISGYSPANSARSSTSRCEAAWPESLRAAGPSIQLPSLCSLGGQLRFVLRRRRLAPYRMKWPGRRKDSRSMAAATSAPWRRNRGPAGCVSSPMDAHPAVAAWPIG